MFAVNGYKDHGGGFLQLVAGELLQVGAVLRGRVFQVPEETGQFLIRDRFVFAGQTADDAGGVHAPMDGDLLDVFETGCHHWASRCAHYQNWLGDDARVGVVEPAGRAVDQGFDQTGFVEHIHRCTNDERVMIGNLLQYFKRLVILPAVLLFDHAYFTAFAVIELDFAKIDKGGFKPALGELLANFFQQGMGAFLAGRAVDHKNFGHVRMSF